jgi:hypothetical protein
MISKKLFAAIKLADEPAYRIAQKADLQPAVLSRLMCGIEKDKPNDPRLIAVGKVLGLQPAECFE